MPSLAKMIDALDASDEFDRRVAVADLVEIGERARPALVRALRDPRPRVRWEAATASGAVAGSNSKAITALADALSDPIRHVRKCASESLGRIGAPAVSVLTERLTSEDPDTVSWAVSAITKIGPPARPAAERLRGATRTART
jgi:HEAT repeat protein